MALVLGFLINSQYSMLWPVSGSMTELTYQLGTCTTCSGALNSLASGVLGVAWDGIGVTLAANWGGLAWPLPPLDIQYQGWWQAGKVPQVARCLLDGRRQLGWGCGGL